MGASITNLIGMEVAMRHAGKPLKQVAVIGDSTFLHSGITGLLDLVYNNCNSCIVILDNSITAMTGHQQNPATGLNLNGDKTERIDIYKLVRDGIGIKNTFVVDGYDVKKLRETLKTEMLKPEPSVIIVRRPCILLFKKAQWSPMKVDTGKCIKCHLCLKVGCPAISTDENGYSRISESLCTGCTVCAQVCPAKAIDFADPEGRHIKDAGLES
jgi:indolepyruvate ferredoxin oxidoreductase alpha subunit